MSFRLTVEVGGLCLFLENEDEERPGLYVLMPDMRGHHGMDHVPLFAFDRKYIGDQGRDEVDIGDREVEITGILNNGRRQRFPRQIAPVSLYAGQLPVLRQFWEEDLPLQSLASRVRLDLGHAIRPFGDIADMIVSFGSTVDRRELVGRAHITMTVPADTITIDGVELTPKAGRMEVGFYNVLDGIIDATPKPHLPGEEQRHFGGYYSLLGLDRGPIPRTAREHPMPPNNPLRTLSDVASLAHIDPVQCTLGGGCPTSDPC